jgi:hypothetical protein
MALVSGSPAKRSLYYAIAALICGLIVSINRDGLNLGASDIVGSIGGALAVYLFLLYIFKRH